MVPETGVDGSVRQLLRDQMDAGRGCATVDELLRVRRGLATSLLERLSQVRPDSTDIARAVDRLAVGVAAGAPPAELARLDLDVTVALVQAADSDVLSLILPPVRAVLERTPSLQAAMYTSPLHNLAAYHALLVWLDDPRPDGISAMVGLLADRDRETVAQCKRRAAA